MMLAKGTPYWIVAIPLLSVLCVLLYMITSFAYFTVISVILLLLFVPVLAFFRDPSREIGEGVVSPADGVITTIEKKGKRVFVSIFMNVHNVHVNRAPIDCQVLATEHVRGGYLPAFDKDSDRNERELIRLGTAEGTWEMKLIAGAVARRIVPYVSEGDMLKKGDRLGMIRFGSRVDLTFRLPRGAGLVAEEGQKVLAGRTSLAR